MAAVNILYITMRQGHPFRFRTQGHHILDKFLASRLQFREHRFELSRKIRVFTNRSLQVREIPKFA